MKTYIIDLDGTMYRGNDNIEGAREFIAHLQEKKIPYIFLTNNATRTLKQAREHMLNLGFENIKETDFFTSAIAAATYIKKEYGLGNCFVVGEDGLIEALKEQKFDINSTAKNVDFVVVGLDRKANYEKYSLALQHILAGAKFIATNTDKLLPNNKKFDIGNGSVVFMLEYASGIQSEKVGKPYGIILDLLLEKYGLNKNEIILIGDNLETDIKLGYDLGIETIMVMTGVHNEKDIEKLKIYPSKYIKNLKELI